MARPVKDDNAFFFDTFLPLCEQSFRFGCFVSNNAVRAFTCLHRAAEEFYNEIKEMDEEEQRLPSFLKHCWQGLEKTPHVVKTVAKDKSAAALAKCSAEERGYLATFDCLGLTEAEAQKIFSLDSESVAIEKVQAVRQQLVSDGDYNDLKPRLQDEFRSVALSTKQRNKLRDLILPGFDAQAVQEQVSSDAESGLRQERLRNYLIVGLCLLVVGITVHHFQQQQEIEEKVIEWISYETLAIEEDPQRLTFPSADTAEIRSYFASHRGLDFQPQLPSVSDGWRPRGAGVIDYDFVRVAVVSYEAHDSDATVLYYSFRGQAENLPVVAEGTVGEFNYRSYTSDQLNMIAWPQQQSVGVLVGRVGTEELVALGQTSDTN